MSEGKPGVWRRFEAAVERLSILTGVTAALAILAAAVIITEGVVTRKIFNMSTTWQIEMSVMLLIYSCFIGSAFVQKIEGHINVDLLIIYLKPQTREWSLLLATVFGLITCGVLAVYGWPMWWKALVNNEHSETIWGPPLWIPYFFLPFGMTLLFCQNLVMIVRRYRQLRAGTYAQEAVRSELKDIELPHGEGRS